MGSKFVTRPVGEVTFPATEWFDPSVIRCDYDLWVSAPFIITVRDLANSGPIEEFTVPYRNLVWSAGIDKIVRTTKMELSPLTACYAIYKLMEWQPNGKRGPALTNGYSNVLPIIGETFARFYWSGVRYMWCIESSERENCSLTSGHRIF